MADTISLRELQRQFSSAMFDNGGRAQQAMGSLSPWVDSSHGLSTAAHLGIYRGSIHGQLNDALGDLFPVCKRLVGDRFFAALCRPYIAEQPSIEPDIGAFGAAFAAHIAAVEAAADTPYLADVARLEWAWHRVFHGPDQATLDLQSLAGVPPESQGSLQFHPPIASRLIESDFPIHTIWQSNQPDWRGEDSIDLNDGGTRLLVWRKATEMRMDPLDDSQWRVLDLLFQGLTLDKMGEQLADQPPAIDIGTVLPGLLQNGWIASFSVA